MIDEHDKQGQAEQTDDHKNTEIVGIVKPLQLYRKKLFFALFEYFRVSRSVHVV